MFVTLFLRWFERRAIRWYLGYCYLTKLLASTNLLVDSTLAPETTGQEKAPKIGIIACEQSIRKKIRRLDIVIAEHIGHVKYSVLKNAIKIFVRSFHMQIHAKGQVRNIWSGLTHMEMLARCCLCIPIVSIQKATYVHHAPYETACIHWITERTKTVLILSAFWDICPPLVSNFSAQITSMGGRYEGTPHRFLLLFRIYIEIWLFNFCLAL